MNGRHRLLAVEIAAMGDDSGHPGADLPTQEGSMADTNTRHVRNAVQLACRQSAAGQADIAGTDRMLHQRPCSFTKAAISAWVATHTSERRVTSSRSFSRIQMR